MVAACYRMTLQSSSQSPARQQSATCGAMSILLDSDEEGNVEESQERVQRCSRADKVKAHLAEKSASKDSHPLVCWNANCQCFPRMAKVAQQMLLFQLLFQQYLRTSFGRLLVSELLVV